MKKKSFLMSKIKNPIYTYKTTRYPSFPNLTSKKNPSMGQLFSNFSRFLPIIIMKRLLEKGLMYEKAVISNSYGLEY